MRDQRLQSSAPGPRMRRFRRRWLDAWLAGGAVLWHLLILAFALALVCYCHGMHVDTGQHCIFF